MKFGDRFYYLWWHWGWFWIGFNHTFLFVPFSFLHFAFVSHPFFSCPFMFLSFSFTVLELSFASCMLIPFGFHFPAFSWEFIFLATEISYSSCILNSHSFQIPVLVLPFSSSHCPVILHVVILSPPFIFLDSFPKKTTAPFLGWVEVSKMVLHS